MKIAMIGHKRIPGREGGVEVVVEELSCGLVKRGHDVTAYNRKKKASPSSDTYKGVKLVDVFTIEKKSLDAVVYSFIASLKVLTKKYDVVHYHAIGPAFFLWIPHMFGIPTVVTVHGLNYKTPKWAGFGAWFIKQGEKVVAKYADRIIVLSNDQREYFLTEYGRDTVYIPNGTEVKDIIDSEEINRFGLKKDGYILFLSRVVPGKGLEYLLDAYKDVESDLNLVIAGDSPFMEDYRSSIVARAATDSRVIFTGFVEGRLLQELYSNARLFVFPSEAEGMPICLLEALSYDCPCLVSDINENLEVGGDYVDSFVSCDTDDLRKKLTEILGKEKVDTGSRQYILDNYSWDDNVEKTIELYGSIIK